jgi:hypothetical protein
MYDSNVLVGVGWMNKSPTQSLVLQIVELNHHKGNVRTLKNNVVAWVMKNYAIKDKNKYRRRYERITNSTYYFIWINYYSIIFTSEEQIIVL